MMIAEFALTIWLSCGVPQMGAMWGGEVQPVKFPVAPAEGGVLIPTALSADFKYITTHPDVVIEHIETIPVPMQPIVCGDLVSS
jgi:hypothetical protein